MHKLWEIAPPITWALLVAASVCLLAAFILLSHTLVRRNAYGEGWSGWRAPGRLERTVRIGLALTATGGALWALTLEAWLWLLVGLAAVALVFGGLEAAALRKNES